MHNAVFAVVVLVKAVWDIYYAPCTRYRIKQLCLILSAMHSPKGGIIVVVVFKQCPPICLQPQGIQLVRRNQLFLEPVRLHAASLLGYPADISAGLLSVFDNFSGKHNNIRRLPP